MMHAMTFFRFLSSAGRLPTHVLFRDDNHAHAVTSVREHADGVAITLDDGRDLLISGPDGWRGVYVTPRLVSSRAQCAGADVRVLLCVPSRAFSARARAAMATMQ